MLCLHQLSIFWNLRGRYVKRKLFYLYELRSLIRHLAPGCRFLPLSHNVALSLLLALKAQNTQKYQPEDPKAVRIYRINQDFGPRTGKIRSNRCHFQNFFKFLIFMFIFYKGKVCMHNNFYLNLISWQFRIYQQFKRSLSFWQIPKIRS